jgi:hypothetical protein
MDWQYKSTAPETASMSWQWNGAAPFSEIVNWCLDHFSITEWHTNGYETFHFAKESSYALFLLRWS